MWVPTSFSFLLGNTVSFTFSLSFSFDPCCPCLQEYIRRQLEEEQRQLEILQQQLLQEQALLLVNGRPRPRLPLSARVASACARTSPRVPPAVPRRGSGGNTSAPPPPLRAGSPRRARLCHRTPPAASARWWLREGSSPLRSRVIPEAAGSMLEHGRAVACLRLANPPCHAGFHLPSDGFCFHFLAGTLCIPSHAVCILDILYFYLICF